jgi:hypothetical protein
MADNVACWNYHPSDAVRPDITCTALTPDLLNSLHYATLKQVEKVMKEPGRSLGDGAIRYLSNYRFGNSGYDGDIDLNFNSIGKLVVISADINFPGSGGITAQYVWNSETNYFCSDIPIGPPPCNGP